MSFLRKEKKSYFENLGTSHTTDNKMFWKTNPCFQKMHNARKNYTR